MGGSMGHEGGASDGRARAHYGPEAVRATHARGLEVAVAAVLAAPHRLRLGSQLRRVGHVARRRRRRIRQPVPVGVAAPGGWPSAASSHA